MEQIQIKENSLEQPKLEKMQKRCEVCQNHEKQLLKCGRCKKVYYCGEECQKKHWPTHKINCSKAKQNCNPQSVKPQQQSNKQQQNQFIGLNQFSKLQHIGSGNFSQIFRATSKKDGKIYAVKQVQKAKVQRMRKQADLFMQKHCLSKLKDCPYAIKLYRTFQDQLNLFIQMQCPQKGQIWDVSRTFGIFSQQLFKHYAAHIIKAVSIFHNDYDIVHRDLKPENILLNANNQIKIIDFGTAKDLSRPDIKGSGNGLKGRKPFEHYVGTPNYMAPECIHNTASQKKSDIYSLSGVLYFLKVGTPPFTGGSQYIVFKKSLQTQMFLCQQLFSPLLKDLILKMNNKKIEQRIDINEVMSHQYFSGIDFNNLEKFQQCEKKISKLQKYLSEHAKHLFMTYNQVIKESQVQKRKQKYEKEIEPYISNLMNADFQITQQEMKFLEARIKVMKIQAQNMINFYDDYSTGFKEIYLKDFDSTKKMLNDSKMKNDKTQQQQEQDKQGQREKQNEKQKDQTNNNSQNGFKKKLNVQSQNQKNITKETQLNTELQKQSQEQKNVQICNQTE